MFIWNGITLTVEQQTAIKAAQEKLKSKKMLLYVAAAIIAIGIILFIRKK
jgi:predicted nucleic acid-binding Zn ribbon protein